jgi:two-component system sensor histidine kinase DesK
VRTSEARAAGNPWLRYGWLIQSVWLVFLVFPLLAVLSGDHPWWLTTAGLVLLVGFGVVYAAGVRRLDRLEKQRLATYRPGSAYFAGLVVTTLLLLPVLGPVGVTSVFPFLVAFAMYGLRRWWGIAVAAAAVAASAFIATVVEPDEGTWVIVFITFAVAVMTGGIGLMSERGRQYEQMQRDLALVEERERVARDVHDVLGHSLTVVTVKAELAERLVDLDPDRARAELAEIQRLSRQALAEVRATVGGLRAARLADELASARTALAGAGIEPHLPDDAACVDPRHRTVLAWVLREAATNVVRHSDADTCWVELDANRLTVRDDGRGIDGRPEGNGLRGLRERVDSAGGRLTLTTGPRGHGTVLEVTL